MCDFVSENISDFVIEVFSVFLGFISAFLLQTYFDKKNERQSKKVILNGIEDELKKVVQILENLTDKDFGIDLYNMPFWDSVVSTGQLKLLTKEPIYEELVSICHKIDTANEWETLNTQAYLFEGKCNSALIKKVIETRGLLCLHIKQFLESYNY